MPWRCAGSPAGRAADALPGSGVSDFALQLDPADLPTLRASLVAAGRVRIDPALRSEAAQELADELSASDAWTRTFRQGSAEREVSPELLASLAPAQLSAIEAFAREDSGSHFRFLHDAIRIGQTAAERQARGWAIDRLVEAFNAPEVLAQMADLAGEPINRFLADATRYLPGHFLTEHNDGRRRAKRVLAAVLGLSDWRLEWGGVLLFHDAAGEVACGWVPRFNSLTLFTVPQPHSVSEVTRLAPHPRHAIAGWFYAD